MAFFRRLRRNPSDRFQQSRLPTAASAQSPHEAACNACRAMPCSMGEAAVAARRACPVGMRPHGETHCQHRVDIERAASARELQTRDLGVAGNAIHIGAERSPRACRQRAARWRRLALDGHGVPLDPGAQRDRSAAVCLEAIGAARSARSATSFSTFCASLAILSTVGQLEHHAQAIDSGMPRIL